MGRERYTLDEQATIEDPLEKNGMNEANGAQIPAFEYILEVVEIDTNYLMREGLPSEIGGIVDDLREQTMIAPAICTS